MTMDSELRLECRILLQQLKTSQQQLTSQLMSQSALAERESQDDGNMLHTGSLCLKPAYARNKLNSVVQGPPKLKGRSVTLADVREEKENFAIKDSHFDSVATRNQQFQSDLSSVGVQDCGRLTTSMTTPKSRLLTSEVTSPSVPKTTDVVMSSSGQPATPNTQRRRQIIDRHTNVPTRLDAQELRELNNVRKLNFNYSQINLHHSELTRGGQEEARGHRGCDKAKYLKVSRGGKQETTSPGLSHNLFFENVARTAQMEDLPTRETGQKRTLTGKKVTHSFKEQLEDDGNNRKLNNFIKNTTIKPKSILNSTDYSLSNSTASRRNNSRVTFNTSQGREDVCPDQRLLGYDWIAALLDNDSHLVNQSESFFNDLREFRRAHKDECSNQFYMAGPHTLVDFEPEPVAEALKEPKVQPYVVNERLFTEPFRLGLIEYEDEAFKQHDIKEPTSDNPRFVRVSIPRSTLEGPYRMKPHRRRSFDASDSCSLMDHCLLGWENTLPVMIPTAKALDLNTEAGKCSLSQTTSLAEAEDLAQNYKRTLWLYDRPGPPPRPLPSWRKHYMDTTLHMSVPAGSSSNLSTSRGSQGSESVKRVTDKLLNSTYATMYEMERLREERKLEMNHEEN